MKITVSLPQTSYPIVIEPDASLHLSSYLNPARKTVLVTDDGIPQKWVDRVASQLDDVFVHTFAHGEPSKNFATLQTLLEDMATHHLDRQSQVIALGGGVVGDLAGFAASCYMRGIDFINIPTTILSQVDSSVGGKTGIDLGSAKNLVGAFKQPQAVIIDPILLETLDARQKSNGLAEALKMALLFDPDLFAAFEQAARDDEALDLQKVIAASVDWKRKVVQKDEKETGLRRSLNFGHTLGHAIEGSQPDFAWLHGECVAAGMLYFIEDESLRRRVQRVSDWLHLPHIENFDKDKAIALLQNDKKGLGDGVMCVSLLKPGRFVLEKKDWNDLQARLEKKIYAD